MKLNVNNNMMLLLCMMMLTGLSTGDRGLLQIRSFHPKYTDTNAKGFMAFVYLNHR